MPPTPEPTPEQIEALCEITRQTSSALIEGKVNAVSDSRWAKLVEDIEAYGDVKDDQALEVNGDVSIKFAEDVRIIRERVCDRLGLPVPTSGGVVSLPGSVVVSTSLRW
jgi:hypothetical protein